MKVKVFGMQEVEIPTGFPCYYKVNGMEWFVLLKDEKWALIVHSDKPCSIEVRLVTKDLIDMYVENGAQVSQNEFASALLKATSVFETYFDKNLVDAFPVPDEEEVLAALYELVE